VAPHVHAHRRGGGGRAGAPRLPARSTHTPGSCGAAGP
jgi:hypothetical protein